MADKPKTRQRGATEERSSNDSLLRPDSVLGEAKHKTEREFRGRKRSTSSDDDLKQLAESIRKRHEKKGDLFSNDVTMEGLLDEIREVIGVKNKTPNSYIDDNEQKLDEYDEIDLILTSIKRIVSRENYYDESLRKNIDTANENWSKLGDLKYLEKQYVDFVTKLLPISREKAVAHFNSLARESGAITPLGRYTDHKHEFPDALAFLKAAYGNRLGIEGDLSITALQRLDIDLFDALKGLTGRKLEELKTLLPHPKARGDAKLMKHLGYIPSDPMERQKALSTIARGGKPGVRGPYRKSRSPS